MEQGQRAEMLFWTKAEYPTYKILTMMDKPLSYYAFEMLYWCGVRENWPLPGDFDFEKRTITISNLPAAYPGPGCCHRPKTTKKQRVIQMPVFL